MHARDTLNRSRALALDLHARHVALRERGLAARAAIEAERTAALGAVAAAYLPSLEPDALIRCAQLSGFRGFERRDPLAARERERKVLESTVTRLEQEPRYREREALVGAAGTVSTALLGAQQALAEAQVPCDRFERHETFLELITAKYDTPQFAVSWWRADYWRLWAAGDRICRALELDDFGDHVLPAYRVVAAPRDLYRAEVARLTAEVDAVHDLVRDRDQAALRLLHLDEIYLEQARSYLAEHLALADLPLLGDWCSRQPGPDTPALLDGLWRLAGIYAKRAHVDELGDGVRAMLAQLELRLGKLDRKRAKLDRGKLLHAADLDDTLAAKAPALVAQADKSGQRLERLVAARGYAGFDPTWAPELWWWHLVGARPPRLYPRLFAWYQAHPDLPAVTAEEAEPVVELDEGVAQAFMAGRDGERAGGYLS